MTVNKLFLILMVCLSLSILPACRSVSDPEQSSAQALPPFPDDAAQIGTSGYFCVTGESEAVDVITSGNIHRTKVYAHQIFSPQKEYLVTLTATITGVHSVQEDTASITDVTSSLSNTAANGITTSQHISKNTGTIVLYWNQQSICHFQYRLTPDGVFTLL